MTGRVRLPLVPAALFGMPVGLAGLGNAWRAAHAAWGTPLLVGELLMGLASVAWAFLLMLYLLKWLFARHEAILEAQHPVQCCFIGLGGVATMLIALAVLPYARPVAEILLIAGATFTLGFAIWLTGLLWGGERDHSMTTPVLYLPTVAGGFVAAIAAAALGHGDWGELAFGAGLFSWLAIESVLLHRLYTGRHLAVALRPTLGILLAPPTVGAVAYLGINGGGPDWVVHALLGYGLLQALLLLRLLPWIMEHPFSTSYWGFSFGISALATAPLRLVARGDGGAVADLAPYLFGCANVAIGLIALGTLRLIAEGRLLPNSTTPGHPDDRNDDAPSVPGFAVRHFGRPHPGGSAKVQGTHS